MLLHLRRGFTFACDRSCFRAARIVFERFDGSTSTKLMLDNGTAIPQFLDGRFSQNSCRVMNRLVAFHGPEFRHPSSNVDTLRVEPI